jgi:hypothetical protein
MGIRMKYFPHETGTNSEQAAAMNAALVTELEMDAKPASMITPRTVPANFSSKRLNSRT